MSYSIGPISFSFLGGHSWDTRRQAQIVNVPFARQTGFSVGAELVSYSLTGTFYADTDAEAKVLRRQLNELFNNPDISFEYIQFDGSDDDELSGWFLLDQISTTILPGIFGEYPFTASVRRLGNIATHLAGTHWMSSPYTNDYTLTGREWVAAPNSLGGVTFNDDRPGEGGENQMIVAPTPLANPIVYRDQPTFPDYFDMACRAYVTQSIAFSSILDALNGTAAKTEIFNNDHMPIFSGVSASSRDRIYVTNGLIAFGYDPIASNAGTSLYLYKTGSSPPWVEVSSAIVLRDSSPTDYLPKYQRRPVFEKISRDEIVFRVLFSLDDDADQNSILVKYKLKRGSYFIDVHVETEGSNIGPTSYLFSVDPLGAINSAANYSVANNSNATIGYLHTETASSIITAGNTHLELGYTIAINSETRFGLVALPLTPPTGTTLANLGNEFIANVTQQQVLIDPRWL